MMKLKEDMYNKVLKDIENNNQVKMLKSNYFDYDKN